MNVGRFQGRKQQPEHTHRSSFFSFLYSKLSKRDCKLQAEGDEDLVPNDRGVEAAYLSESLRELKDKEEAKEKIGCRSCELLAFRTAGGQPEVLKIAETVQASSTVIPQQQENNKLGRDTQPSSRRNEMAIDGRSFSDSSAWNFTRVQAVRRTSRCAQEWVRTSNVTEASNADWSRDLQLYTHRWPQSHEFMNTGTVKEPHHRKEDGLLFRKRSKSAEELGTGNTAEKVSMRKSAEATRNPLLPELKSSQLDAGLEQHRKPISARQSAKETGKDEQSQSIKYSDFLPVELVQRSLLFNSGAAQHNF